MKTHPLLRAYMAGIAAPTMFLLVIMTGFMLVRFVFDVSVPVERAIVFPMAIVPNLWGVWNMLYLRSHARWGHSLGVHGAVLPVLLMPLGIILASVLLPSIVLPGGFLLLGFGLAVIVYYLVWKHVVGYFNHVLGVA